MDESYKNPKLSPRERAECLIKQMTLREKVGQLCQSLYGFRAYTREGEEITPSPEFLSEVERFGGLGVLYGLFRADPWSEKLDFSQGLFGKYAVCGYNALQKAVMERSRFGIPMLVSTEAPHGHQAIDGYLLPVNLAIGATFDPEAYEGAQRMVGKQLRELGVNFALVSALDILRDPRWGRSEECYSEDPFLSSRLAAAAVRGIQSAGVGMIAKHFCAQGETTGGINTSAARIGERELREIHLPAAKACCEAKVAGVMAAYNEIDGVYCHANRHLLTDILRDEFGMQGVVMADGCGLDLLNETTGDPARTAAIARNAGVDISLWDRAFPRLEEAVERGLLPESKVDEAVLRVLTFKFAQGLFEQPCLPEETPPAEYAVSQYPQTLELSRKSVVLLKNDGELLPLESKKVAVIGHHAFDIYNQLGDYTPPLRTGQGITVLEGIRKLRGEANVVFAQGFTFGKPLLQTEVEEACRAAEECDVTVLVLGGSSNRFSYTEFGANGAAIVQAGAVSPMDCGEGVDKCEIVLLLYICPLVYGSQP